jgi:hypothetical protein
LPFHRDEGLEAGVAPQLGSKPRRNRRWDPDSGNISVEAKGHPEFSAGRSTHEHLNGAHCLSACRGVAGKVDPVFDGHSGLDGVKSALFA